MNENKFNKSMTYAPGLPEGATFYSDHKKRVTSHAVSEAAENALKERGVTIEDIAEIVFDLQKPFMRGLTMADCVENVRGALAKRELQHAMLVGIELDSLAE
ncbi:phosphatidylglycerophosphatase A, partial [Sporolactobacillus sp. THM7-4]